jgi:hypothetical protein
MHERQQQLQSEKIHLAEDMADKAHQKSELDVQDVSSPETLEQAAVFQGDLTKGHLYASLDARDTFRLIELLPGWSGDLRCHLHVRKLTKSMGSYEALSYTWDTEYENECVNEIICNGHKQLIHQNLYEALQTLRRPHESRLLWIDAICIDQNNTAEKSQQVKIMGTIFAKAQRVLIWIGQREDKCLCGEFTLSSSSETISEVFAGICSIMNKWLTHNGRDDLVAAYSERHDKVDNLVEDKAWNKNIFGRHAVHEDKDTGLGVGTNTLQKIVDFFSRRWFFRIWVIQEVVLSSNAQVVWGTYNIAWDWVGLAAAIIQANSSSLSFLGYSSIPNGLMNAFLMYRLSASQTCLPPLKFSFVQVLQLTQQFASTNAHDRIYGLLGLKTTDSVAATIEPNYDMNVMEVYENVARLILVSDNSLALLSSARPGSYLHSKPSWVPRWSEATFYVLRPIYTHPEFRCASQAPRDFRYPSNKPELELRGVILEKINVLPNHQLTAAFWYSNPNENSRNECLIQSMLNKLNNSKQAIESLAMTWTRGTNWKGYPVDSIDSHAADYFAALFSGYLDLTIINDSIPSPNKISEKVLGPSLQLAELKKLSQEGDYSRYLNYARDICEDHTIFTTLSGRIGIAPRSLLKEGDLLCVFFGADVPFLIRPKGDGYILLSECYVYNIMHGEILNQLSDLERRGELKEEWIKLI